MARRRGSSRRRRRGGFGFLYKLLSMLAICAVIVVALTLFFRVDAIVVTGTERYTPQEVERATGVSRGDNLILLNKYDVNQNVRRELPYVEELRINRELPDTLLIDVQECGTPLAVVQDGSAWLISPSKKSWVVDQKDPAEAADLAVVDGCRLLAPSVGTPIALSTEYASQQQSLLDLLAALKDAEMLDQVDAIHLGDISLLTMDYAGRFSVELPYGADYDFKLRALQVVVDTLETNQTGVIQLTREDGAVHFIEN